MKNVWKTIKLPILGLSPMDGITDPAFRAVVDTLGHPHVLFTEFVSAEGICRNRNMLLRTFRNHNTNTPLIGQLFGADPSAMEEAAAILIEQTPISGIDINMGCPNKHVAKHGGGAALIQTPTLAQQLISSVKSAISKCKKPIGLSVKTRIGFDSIVTKSWIHTLLEGEPDAIILHGRTLKQMYTGVANWDEIRIAATLAKQTHTLLLGNGDIKTIDDAIMHITNDSPNGVLIGRASCGNPWVFTKKFPSSIDLIDAAILHVHFFKELTPDSSPLTLRKHLGWYVKGFPQAARLRQTLITISSIDEALDHLTRIKQEILSSA